jgi:hypothetical protein
MKTKLLSLIGLVAFLAIAAGPAQAETGFRANIPFSFVVTGAVLPPGDYIFLSGNSLEYVEVVSLAKGPSAGATIVTRLQDRARDMSNYCQAVFDKVGDTYTLAELWLPEMRGFQIYASKEPHERRVVLNGLR